MSSDADKYKAYFIIITHKLHHDCIVSSHSPKIFRQVLFHSYADIYVQKNTLKSKFSLYGDAVTVQCFFSYCRVKDRDQPCHEHQLVC